VFWVIDRVNVTACTALNEGGAMYILANNVYLTIEASYFAGNLASNNGAGVFIVSNNKFMNIFSSVFLNNAAGNSGGGICTDVLNDFLTISDRYVMIIISNIL
jgi:predicted outer membrane repeat protein